MTPTRSPELAMLAAELGRLLESLEWAGVDVTVSGTTGQATSLDTVLLAAGRLLAGDPEAQALDLPGLGESGGGRLTLRVGGAEISVRTSPREGACPPSAQPQFATAETRPDNLTEDHDA